MTIIEDCCLLAVIPGREKSMLVVRAHHRQQAKVFKRGPEEGLFLFGVLCGERFYLKEYECKCKECVFRSGSRRKADVF